MQFSENLTIKKWATEDRPREKLVLKGKTALSDAELIAILIGSGTRELSAVELAKSILSDINNDLNQLARLTIKDLKKFNGIGEAKAISIISALELGRRRNKTRSIKKLRIQSSVQIYNYLKPYLLDLDHEQFWVLFLNRANEIIKSEPISSGGVAGTIVDPKIIFKRALEHGASYVILAHNHPSGTLNPSQEDINLTKRIKEAGRTLELPILDHIIFTDHDYFSFSDRALL